MDIFSGIIAGIGATFAMTILMILASLVTGYNLRPSQFLGTMLTFQTTPLGDVSRSAWSLILGNLLHYSIGVCFALLYQQIQPEVYELTLLDGLLYGLGAGVAALIFWYSAFKLHPLAPKVNLPLYLILIFLGHLLFGVDLEVILYLLSK